MVSPPEYNRDFLLHVGASQETIGMVLVLEDDELDEHVIILAKILLTQTLI